MPLSTPAFVTESLRWARPHPGQVAARQREAEKSAISPKVLVAPYWRAP
jgi:hypothetical protein